jgi:hypothetical protein
MRLQSESRLGMCGLLIKNFVISPGEVRLQTMPFLPLYARHVILFGCLGFCLPVAAQQPSLAFSNIEFSNNTPHLVAKVRLGDSTTKISAQYQYDRYTVKRDVRIRLDGIDYVKNGDKAWKKSSDWGETGTEMDAEMAGKLDMYAGIVELTFAKHTSRDPAQGGFVWRPISVKHETKDTLFCYELSREHPKPDGYYSHFTFIKYPDDTDGQLLLTSVEANLRSDTYGEVPVTMNFDYLFPMPAGSTMTIAGQPNADTAGFEVNLVSLKELALPTPGSTPGSNASK